MNPRKKLPLYVAGAVTVVIIAALVGIWLYAADSARSSFAPKPDEFTVSPADYGMPDYEDVLFETSDGLTLSGWWVAGDNGAAIIMAHGHGGNRLALIENAAVLHRHGYSVLMFDFRAHGESEGDVARIGTDEWRDVIAAVDFVSAQPGIEHIGASGVSMGGVSVIEAAAQDDRLEAVISEVAFTTLRDVLRWRADQFGIISQIPVLYTANRYGLEPRDVRPIDDLCSISPRPVMLTYSLADDTLSPDTPDRMIDAACDPLETWVVDGAAHGSLFKYDPAGWETRAVAFFDMALLNQ